MKNDSIQEYCINHSEIETPLQKKNREYTYKNERYPQMISGMQVGNILQSLILLSKSKKVLEIGMFTGYSALKMAEVLPNNGKLHTCEIGENHINTARKFFDKSNHGAKIVIHAGPALKSIKKFKTESFDFCFIDADKNNYKNYYIECIKLLKKNGCLLIDNMLWGGEVLKPKDKESKTIAETAKFINNDASVYNTMLTIRDGLMLCIKK